LQDALAASGILGCRLCMFEQIHHGAFRPAEDYTEAALASFGSHDVPTWEGWRKGTDIDLRHDLGYLNATDHRNALDWRQGEVDGFDALAGTGSADIDGDVDAMHRFLGSVRSCLVAAQIEDILGVVEQPNLPGTVDTHPNWRRRLPVGASGLAGHPSVTRIAEIMRESGRQE
jgi:4-alpha-glucanotransferase